ncbi:MAG: hypothetical protein QXW82_07770 [Candidatus Bathyarchaeia archaeon]
MKRAGILSPSSKLFIFSIIYGLFYINYIDLVVPGSNVPGYHAWLGAAYFISFVPVILIWGVREWKLVLCLGLTASLMNDLFYYPVSLLLFGKAPDLYNWYMFQLGFKGFTRSWTFNAGFFTFPMTSLLMGVSIYLRIAIIAALAMKGRVQGKGRWMTGWMMMEKAGGILQWLIRSRDTRPQNVLHNAGDARLWRKPQYRA